MEPRYRFPVLSGTLAAVQALYYIQILTLPVLSEPSLADYWVYLDPARIWKGAYWGLLSGAFAHLNAMALLFNLFLFWPLAIRIEMVLGRQLLFATVFFGALVTSGAQLALGTPALGNSGVVFALLGLVWGARKRISIFEHYLRPPTGRVVSVWILFSLLAGLSGLWHVGLAANLAGFLFGVAVAWGLLIERWPWRVTAGAIALALAAVTALSVSWLPWDPGWVNMRASKEIERQNYAKALAILAPLTARKEPSVMNATAWTLATAYDARVRDGRRAIALAREAITLDGWQEPGYIDTLAAAYAETGDWARAEATQKIALKVLADLEAALEESGGEVAQSVLDKVLADLEAAIEESGGEVAQSVLDEVEKNLKDNYEKIKQRVPIRE